MMTEGKEENDMIDKEEKEAIIKEDENKKRKKTSKFFNKENKDNDQQKKRKINITTTQQQATITTSSVNNNNNSSSSQSIIITNRKDNQNNKKKIRVVKLQRKNGKIIQNCDVYIGRRIKRGGWDLPQSKWANPFTVNKCGSSEEAIKKYKEYILEKPELLKDLNELDGKVLGCWCKSSPNVPCHGDVLVELVNKKLKEEKENQSKQEEKD
ncbi:hypothetical protein ABK040_003719 [Willaertia magna]